MNTSQLFYPNEQNKSAKKGKVPLYIRIILNGKKSEGPLNHTELTEKEVLQWNERAMRLSDAKHMANKLINALQRELDEFIILNSKNLNQHTATSIRNTLLGRNKVEVITVFSYIDNFFTAAIAKNENLACGTKKFIAKP